eukprot:2210823-Rhodomonas_salina.1
MGRMDGWMEGGLGGPDGWRVGWRDTGRLLLCVGWMHAGMDGQAKHDSYACREPRQCYEQSTVKKQSKKRD